MSKKEAPRNIDKVESLEDKEKWGKQIEEQLEDTIQQVYEVEFLMSVYPEEYPPMLSQFAQLAPLAVKWNEDVASGVIPSKSEFAKKVKDILDQMKVQARDIVNQYPWAGDRDFLVRMKKREAVEKIYRRLLYPGRSEGREYQMYSRGVRFTTEELENFGKEEKEASKEANKKHEELLKENAPLLKEYGRLAEDLDVAFRSGQLEDETEALSAKVKRFKELAEDLRRKRIFYLYEYKDQTPWEKQLEDEEKILAAAGRVQEKRQGREARREGVRYWRGFYPE